MAVHIRLTLLYDVRQKHDKISQNNSSKRITF